MQFTTLLVAANYKIRYNKTSNLVPLFTARHTVAASAKCSGNTADYSELLERVILRRNLCDVDRLQLELTRHSIDYQLAWLKEAPSNLWNGRVLQWGHCECTIDRLDRHTMHVLLFVAENNQCWNFITFINYTVTKYLPNNEIVLSGIRYGSNQITVTDYFLPCSGNEFWINFIILLFKKLQLHFTY